MQHIILIILYSLSIVTTDRILVNVPEANNITLTGNVIGRFDVLSLSECAGLCDINNCRSINYDETNHVCVVLGVNEMSYTSPEMNDFGKVYMHRDTKSCSYSGYEYIWELDICVKYYYEVGDKLTWEESQTRCENEAGNIITVSNQEKNELFLPYLIMTYEITGHKKWWIGANDKDEEGVFRWVSGVEVTYRYWDQGQPDNYNSQSNVQNADCAQFFFRTVEQSFAWFDITCDSLIGAICENQVFS